MRAGEGGRELRCVVLSRDVSVSGMARVCTGAVGSFVLSFSELCYGRCKGMLDGSEHCLWVRKVV